MLDEEANRRSCCGTQIGSPHKPMCRFNPEACPDLDYTAKTVVVTTDHSDDTVVRYSTERKEETVKPADADPGLHPELYAGKKVDYTITPDSIQQHRVQEVPPNAYVMRLEAPRTRQGLRVLKVAEQALDLFITKNSGYGEPDDEDLGARGQYADMHRKWKRIKKHLWDGQPWEGEESFEEVLMDFVGHLLLTIDFERQARVQ